MEKVYKYAYDGPVMYYGKIFNKQWKGETVAPSESKARSNLRYQYAQANNRKVTTGISLPGKITKID